MRRVRCWAVWLLIPCCVVGCRPDKSAVKSRDDMTRYAALPGLSQTHDQELRAEFARLIDEQATPRQLADRLSGSLPNQSSPGASSEQSPPPKPLDTIFPPNFRDSLRKRLDSLWPEDGFEFTPATLHASAAFTERYEKSRAHYRELVTQVDYEPPNDILQGLMADRKYLDAMEIGHRLEGLHAARRLAASDPAAAVDAVRVMLRGSELLANQPNLVTRGAATARRGETLQVIAAIVQHPAATPSIHRQLGLLLHQQLERWPPDTRAWIGDRAQGLHTYELVRDGYLLSLLTAEEIRAQRDQHGNDQWARAVTQNIDRDELFYLQTMRDVIAACEKPHYARAELWRQIETNLDFLRRSHTYPFVADVILLRDMEAASRGQALDRARCEAWTLAFDLATGVTPPLAPLVNPLTGAPYKIDIQGDHVIVDEIDPTTSHPPAIVPKQSADTPR